MNSLDTITIIAILSFLISFFIGKNAIRVTLSAGLLIAAGWALNDVTNGTGINWAILKQLLIVATLAGATWELLSRLINIIRRKTLGQQNCAASK